MKPLRHIEGAIVPVDHDNIDTDTIIPQQWMVTTSRKGLGKGFFADWRQDADGTPNRTFALNLPKYAGARILLANNNYGCGSSREHAVWAHLDFGVQAVIAASFGSIFYGNAFKCGLLAITLPHEQVRQLFDRSRDEVLSASIEVATQTLRIDPDIQWQFDLDDRRRRMLLDGADEITESLRHRHEIDAFQDRDRQKRPWIWNRSPG
ncbi:MAG: 3-isopropylmalate dehydratase small subunit [Rhizobiaceae bacterium]|nr:3-isopropylmalate dehydratase small subunit [Rhizobiaceae bacterium]